MGDKSKIEWTDATWNFLYGCSEVSPGCAHCYAKVLSARFAQDKKTPQVFQGVAENKNGKAYWTGKINWATQRMDIPKNWKKPRMVFVNSMSDTFHENVELDVLKQAFAVMGDSPQHIFQVLTKRHERLASMAPNLTWHDNIWMGVTVENKLSLKRIGYLLATDARIKFLSMEPLLEDVGKIPQLEKLDWVIVGGESGKNPRPMKEEWVLNIRDQCARAGVKFFFKQWGGKNKKDAGRELQGRFYDEMPATLVPYSEKEDDFTILQGQQLMWENHSGMKNGEKVVWKYE